MRRAWTGAFNRILSSQPSTAGLAEIKMRGESHDRHHLDIKPHLYDLWLSSVIASARIHDKSWDTRTEDAWKTILGHVIHRMKKAY